VAGVVDLGNLSEKGADRRGSYDWMSAEGS